VSYLDAVLGDRMSDAVVLICGQMIGRGRVIRRGRRREGGLKRVGFVWCGFEEWGLVVEV
jgi:hypothetical protein